MSDLFETRRKVEEGADWRGKIEVAIDDDTHELTVRQLYDPELWEVMSKVDTDEIEELQDQLPEEKMEEFETLKEKDSLTDAESERLEELQTEVEDSDLNLFDVLSMETYDGLKTAAKYGVEPDEQDIQRALTENAAEISEMYGATNRENATKYVNDHIIATMIEESTNFTSFTIGVSVLGEALGDEGN